MGEIISKFSLKSLTKSVSLPTHDPISFGFEEMVRAKADNAKIKQELMSIGKVYKEDSNSQSNDSPTENTHSEYIYDYNLLAEISEIKRNKNNR